MKTDGNYMYELTLTQRKLDAKLAKIAALAERNAEPEFGGTFFRRLIARKGN